MPQVQVGQGEQGHSPPLRKVGEPSESNPFRIQLGSENTLAFSWASSRTHRHRCHRCAARIDQREDPRAAESRRRPSASARIIKARALLGQHTRARARARPADVNIEGRAGGLGIAGACELAGEIWWLFFFQCWVWVGMVMGKVVVLD